jgi:hypothetical protein
MQSAGKSLPDSLRYVPGGYGFDSRTFDPELIGNILIFDVKMEHEFPELIWYCHKKSSCNLKEFEKCSKFPEGSEPS